MYLVATGFTGYLSRLSIPPSIAAAATTPLWIGAAGIAALTTVVLLYALTRDYRRIVVLRRCVWMLAVEYAWIATGVLFTTVIANGITTGP